MSFLKHGDCKGTLWLMNFRKNIGLFECDKCGSLELKDLEGTHKEKVNRMAKDMFEKTPSCCKTKLVKTKFLQDVTKK